MSSDRVIVVKADDVRAVLAEYEPLMEARGQRGEATEIDRLRAALDTDRGQWVKRIRAAIAAGRLRERGGLQTTTDTAREVLARIEEGANGE